MRCSDGVGGLFVRKNAALVGVAGVAAVAGAITGIAPSAYANGAASTPSQVSASLGTSWVTVEHSNDVAMEVVPTASGALGVGKDTVTVKTNSSEGYKLYISGANNDSNGYTALYYNGNTVATDKILGSTNVTPANLSANSWGYAVPAAGGYAEAAKYATAVSSSGYNGAVYDASKINELTWKGLNTTQTQIMSNNTANEAGHATDVYYGTLVNTSQMAGSYRNTVYYTAFTEGAGMVATEPYIADGQRTTITASYQSAVYPVSANNIRVTFLDGNNTVGTCDSVNLISDGSTDLLKFTCVMHAAGGITTNKKYDVKVDVNTAGHSFSFTRNDIWQYIYTLGDGTMQSMTASVCNAAEPFATGSKTYTMKDTRDGKYYAVRKLKANTAGTEYKCWMVQNLDLDLYVNGSKMAYKDENGQLRDFTAGNTNLPTGTTSWTIPSGSYGYNTQKGNGNGTVGNDPGVGIYWNQRGCAGTGAENYWTSSTYSQTPAACSTGDGTYEVRSYDEGNRCANDNITDNASYGSCTDAAYGGTELGMANTKSMGNMYNWAASTAGEGRYTKKTGNTSQSICPSGWRLPTGSNTGEMANLFLAEGVISSVPANGSSTSWTSKPKMYGDPISAVRSGNYYFSTSALADRGTSGYWWSSTAYSETNSYYLGYNSSHIYPGTDHSLKGFGFPVRCVAQ